VLIDSGASYCLFGHEVAVLLGINVPTGNLKKVGTVGRPVDVYFFSLSLSIRGITTNCYAGFLNSPFPGDSVHFGLLENLGFLDTLPITLDPQRLEIRIG